MERWEICVGDSGMSVLYVYKREIENCLRDKVKK
jgi:hypothetical protein